MGWQQVWRPFGPKTEPVSEEAPASEQGDVPEVEPQAPAPKPSPVPDVPRTVQHAANTLAQRVWAVQVTSRGELLQGVGPPNADRYLAYAVANDWVQVDGNRITRGLVNPVPPDPVAEKMTVSGSRGWETWTLR